MSDDPLISLSRCSVILNDHVALDEVTFDLRRHERWLLIGPNGAGKSMLLKLLRGDVWPTPTGNERRTYCFDGEPVNEPAGSKSHIAYIAPERQDKYVRYDWNLTVTQVVTTGLFDEDIPLTRPTAAQRARVARLLKRFRLWPLRSRGILTLSYGQRRRTLIARAFAGDAEVLLLDEAFNGLDDRSCHILRAALEHGRGRGPSWVVSTHRATELPSNVTHVARIESGRIVQSGPVTGDLKTLLADLRHAVRPPRARAAPLKKRAPRGSDGPLVRLRGVELYREYRKVLRGIDWTLARGEHWAVLGGNGSGKSTLLLLIYGDLHPALGGVVERDRLPRGTPISEWKRRVGFVSPELQADHFLAGTIEEIVASGRHASVGLNEPLTAADRRAARPWLKFFGLEYLAHRTARQVSYGQMRLALIARAMVNDPELLLLDEPCTGLDPDVRTGVLGMIQRLAERGTQLVMAVHDAEDIVPAIGHVLRIGRGGRVVEEKRLS